MVGAQRAVTMLAIAGVAVGVMSEILVGSITEAADVDRPVASSSSASIVVAIVGNAAEHWVAVFFAAKDKMDLRSTSRSARARRSRCSWRPRWSCLALRRAVSDVAGLQRARARGDHAGGADRQPVTHEGESTWFEGVQLLAVYVVLAAPSSSRPPPHPRGAAS